MANGEREVCPICGEGQSVSAGGALRRHPKGAQDPCSGSGHVVRGPDSDRSVTDAPVSDPTAVVGPPRRLAPGVYRSSEPMLDRGTPCPPGHVTVAIVMHLPFDGSNGRTPREEAALLFHDPAYLYRAMDSVPNAAIRISMKVDP